MIRILVADDHPVVRDGLVAMLGTQPDFIVVGEAASGRELLDRAAQIAFDIVLLDLEMPELDGAEALRELRARSAGVRALVFTAFDTDERIVAAIQAGAQGYMLKGSPRSEIFAAIRTLAAGGTLLSPVVQSRLVERLRSPGAAGSPEPLTPREIEVLRLLVDGRMNKEIAAALSITERTVKFHVGAILAKLGAGNRTEAARLAAQRGIVL